MASSQNYYAVLKVEANADLDTIKQAYRKQIRLYHPDQFAAEHSRVKQSGDTAAISRLEKKIDHARQMSQRLNEAYSVLSDATDRVAYDRYLSEERQRLYYEEFRRQRMQHREDGRRTVKSRPHHQNPNFRYKPDQDERVPWVLLILLMGLVLFVSSMFSNVLTSNHTPATTYIPGNTTSAGGLQARDLQATSNAEHATYVARTTTVFDPTATPLSSSANERLGDRYMNFEMYDYAITAYNNAIDADSDNALIYLKRGIAYTALYQRGDVDAVELALADYDEAITLDESQADAYLARGMLYYELWLVHDAFAEEVQADLLAYLGLAEPDDPAPIEAILAEVE